MPHAFLVGYHGARPHTHTFPAQGMQYRYRGLTSPSCPREQLQVVFYTLFLKGGGGGGGGRVLACTEAAHGQLNRVLSHVYIPSRGKFYQAFLSLDEFFLSCLQNCYCKRKRERRPGNEGQCMGLCSSTVQGMHSPTHNVLSLESGFSK